MPRDEIRSRKSTDVYSVMLILAWVFLVGALILTYLELDEHYDFGGSAAKLEMEEEEGEGLGDDGLGGVGEGEGAGGEGEPPVE